MRVWFSCSTIYQWQSPRLYWSPVSAVSYLHHHTHRGWSTYMYTCTCSMASSQYYILYWMTAWYYSRSQKNVSRFDDQNNASVSIPFPFTDLFSVFCSVSPFGRFTKPTRWTEYGEPIYMYIYTQGNSLYYTRYSGDEVFQRADSGEGERSRMGLWQASDRGALCALAM